MKLRSQQNSELEGTSKNLIRWRLDVNILYPRLRAICARYKICPCLYLLSCSRQSSSGQKGGFICFWMPAKLQNPGEGKCTYEWKGKMVVKKDWVTIVFFLFKISFKNITFLIWQTPSNIRWLAAFSRKCQANVIESGFCRQSTILRECVNFFFILNFLFTHQVNTAEVAVDNKMHF